MTVEDDSAKVVEIVKDTSSQTITMTVDEPPEPEIVIVKPGRAITADDTAMSPARSRRSARSARPTPDALRPVVLGQVHRDVAELGVRDHLERHAVGVVGEPDRERARRLARTRRSCSGARETTRRRCASRGDCRARSRSSRCRRSVTSTRHSRRPPTTNTVRVVPGARPPAADLRHRRVRVVDGDLAEVDVERVRLRIVGAGGT